MNTVGMLRESAFKTFFKKSQINGTEWAKSEHKLQHGPEL